MSEFYRKGYDSGLRWDDKAIDIDWPIRDGITISEKDAGFDFVSKRQMKSRICNTNQKG